jgi:Holliday junction DNA helicase RuvA
MPVPMTAPVRNLLLATRRSYVTRAPLLEGDNGSFMIAHLRGMLLEKHPNQLVVDVGGVGYDVTIPVSTFSAVPDPGSEVKLRIHTHVREDAIALFGFASVEEKTIFEKLISVSGIGPKLAITVLSGLPTGDLVQAIRQGQLERLVRIPGVGKKTGERIILELRDKLEGVGLPAAAPPQAKTAEPALSDIEQDVLSALVNLGCARPNAEAAIRKAKTAGAESAFEPLFRKSLELVR